METDKYYNYFLPALKAQGYEGCFCPKSRSKTLPEEERKHVDGCAIFFNKTKWVFQGSFPFYLVEVQHVDRSEQETDIVRECSEHLVICT